MTRRTNARVAGFAFLLYIAAAFTGCSRASSAPWAWISAPWAWAIRDGWLRPRTSGERQDLRAGSA